MLSFVFFVALVASRRATVRSSSVMPEPSSPSLWSVGLNSLIVFFMKACLIAGFVSGVILSWNSDKLRRRNQTGNERSQ